MNAFTQAAAVLALRKMFEENHFNICTIDTLIRTTGVVVPRETYNAWHLLHCVNYNTMTKAMRDELFEQVIDAFKAGPAFDMNRLNEVAGVATYLEPTESKSTTLVVVQPAKRKWLPW